MTIERSKSGAGRARSGRNGEAAVGQDGAMAAEARHEMIATAAYLRAEQRGFCGGDSLDDWLAAESEVDQRLRRSPAANN